MSLLPFFGTLDPRLLNANQAQQAPQMFSPYNAYNQMINQNLNSNYQTPDQSGFMGGFRQANDGQQPTQSLVSPQQNPQMQLALNDNPPNFAAMGNKPLSPQPVQQSNLNTPNFANTMTNAAKTAFNTTSSQPFNPVQQQIGRALGTAEGQKIVSDLGLKVPQQYQNTVPLNADIPVNDRQDRINNAVNSAQNTGSYMDIARSYLGNDEVHSRDTLEAFFQKSGGLGKVDPTQTAWCAAFANSVLGAGGVKGTGSLSARSFMGWGTPTDNPTNGDIVVFRSTNPNDNVHGHVAFYMGRDPKNPKNILVLGGNQATPGSPNSVSIASRPASRVIGYREPPNAQALGYSGNQPQPSQTALNDNQFPLKSLTSPQPMDQNQPNSQPPQVASASLTPDLQQQFSDRSLTRGIRNNNPGNLERTGAPNELNGGDKRFAQFGSPEEGLNALSNTLSRSYNNMTLSQVINKYAPSSENNTRSYIKQMSQITGLNPNVKLNMNDPATKQAMMKGIIQIENGSNPYSDKQIMAAVSPKNNIPITPPTQVANAANISHPDISGIASALTSLFGLGD